MKMKAIPAFAAAAALAALLPFAAFAAPASRPAAKPSKAPVMYRAQCGMTYTAAEAKKDHYVCPMDGQKMTLILPLKVQPAGRKK